MHVEMHAHTRPRLPHLPPRPLPGRARRPSYLAAWPTVINWPQVQANFDAAGGGQLDSLYCGTQL